MKKRISEAGACLAVYILLILLLTAAESGAGGSIRNWTDAVWYSVVTMTTVGYGDLYPVSPAGRIIGFVFLLLSLGFLAFIISAAVSGLKERWMPQLKLLRRKKRTWFVFSEKNGAAEILAEELTENHPGAIAVFCKTEGGTSDGKICVPFGIEALCGRKVFCSGERKLFFISEDASENRQEAQQLNSCGQAYCFSPETDGIPGVRFFDIAEACARTYWKRYPLEPGEGPVALIGDGRFARALADQAVCVNCMTPFASDSYFLHGDWSVYRQLHPQLERGPKAEGSAEFFFMETPWTAEELAACGRIILCCDDFAVNAEKALKIGRWLALSPKLYVLGADSTVPGTCFGSETELLTEENVLGEVQDRAARAMHETYRGSVGGNVPEWEELNGFLKASNRAASDHIPVKRMLLERFGSAFEADFAEKCRMNEHERWLRFHMLYNWKYGPVRDNTMRCHPSMRTFDKLTEEEKAKDDLAWKQPGVRKTESEK